MKPTMAFAMYKPKPGKKDGLMKLVEQHVPTLREFGMVSDRNNYVAESENGTIIEIFEWNSEEAKRAAHEHPAIAAIWEKMYAVSTFETMNTLPEAAKMFPDFKVVK